MPRRWSGSAAVPTYLGLPLEVCDRLLAHLVPNKRQDPRGLSRPGAEALRREPGLAASATTRAFTRRSLTGFDRRSQSQGTDSPRLPRAPIAVRL